MYCLLTGNVLVIAVVLSPATARVGSKDYHKVYEVSDCCPQLRQI